MSSILASQGDQCSQPESIHNTEDESTSEISQSLESDENEDMKEDELMLEQNLPGVVKTSTKAKHRAKKKKKKKKKSWWQKRWQGWRGKVRSKKSKKKRKKGKSTVLMLRHHHATFAHLIHDAFLRLECSPIHRYGYSHKQILKNISRHYRLKLGKKFKVRLQLSFDRLLKKGLVVTVGSAKKKYKPTVAFVRKFARLKVIDGAANRRYGVEIGKYRRRRRRGRSRSRHKRRRRRSKSKRRRRRRKRRKRRRKHRSSSRAHSRGKKTKSKKGSSSNYFGLTNWLWPSKENKVEEEKNTKATAHNEERNTNSKHSLGKWNHMSQPQNRKHDLGRGLYGRSKGARYNRFQRLRIGEREKKPVFFTSTRSAHTSKVDSHSMPTDAPRGSLDPIDNSPYETSPSSVSDIDEDDDDGDVSNTSSDGSTPRLRSRSKKEHELHAIREGSQRSFFSKVGDSLRGAFGSSRMSTTTCKGGPSGHQNFLKAGSSSERSFEIGPKTT